MRIALICTEKLPVPPVAGGAVQLYIEGVVPYLAAHHEVTVFCIQHPELPANEVRNGVKYIRISATSKNGYVAKIKPYLKDNFDLIHVFNRPQSVLTLSEGVSSNVRFGLSLHNEMFHEEKITDEQALECVNRVDFINTVSKFIADGVKARVPCAEEKLNVIYSGADIGAYEPSGSDAALENKKMLLDKYGLTGYKVILYVGRLSVKKGVDILLKAVKSVMDFRDDVALVIVGSKWYGKNEKDDYTASLEILSKKLKGPIVFTGFLPPSEIPLHYNIGDIFVCSSQWNEPLARVHYETMAAGLPIITTARGGNAEVVEKGINGLVLDDKSYNNPERMAEYINYLLDKPQIAAQLGKNGRRLAEKHYNWERVANNILDVLSRPYDRGQQ